MMNNKVISALTYLTSLLEINDNEEVVLSVTNGKVYMSNTKDRLNIEEATIDKNVNPIKDVFNAINEEICTDCLKLDYYFKDPFYVSLVKAYIDGLVHEFGKEVPITRTLAKVILEHKLSPYQVSAKPKNSDKTTPVNDPNALVFDPKWDIKFYLVV